MYQQDMCLLLLKVEQSAFTQAFFSMEWLFVRARTDRILAIRTAYDHVTIQVASRDKLR